VQSSEQAEQYRGSRDNFAVEDPSTEKLRSQKSCSDVLKVLWTAVFLDFGFRLRQGYGGQVVSAQLQGFQTCSFAEASPKSKNPCRTPLQLFCQCSKKTKLPHLNDGKWGS
jgi:hypothetical protein